MGKQRLVRVLGAAACTAALLGPAGPAAAKELKLTLAGYSAAGIASAMGQAVGAAVIKQNPGTVFNYEPGQGGANEIKVSRGDTELGLSSSILMGPALKGQEPFKEKLDNLRALSFLHTNDMMVVLDGRSGIQSIEDFKTKPVRIGVGSKHSFMEITARLYLEMNGITYEDIEKRGGKAYFMQKMATRVDQLRDRQLDAIVEPLPTPASILIDASSTIELRVPPVGKDIIAKAVNDYGFRPITIPKSAYPFLKEDLPTFAVDNIMICSAQMSNELAYAIVKAMYDNLEDLKKVGYMKHLTPDQMPLVGRGIPLHPGAEKFYREVGALK
ncbi:MAG: TAXI family TRAP transporter solute-binding subunit [Deferrisomatales bacterium]